MKRFAKIAAISLAMTTAAAAQPYHDHYPAEHHDYNRYDRYRGREARRYDRGPGYRGDWITILDDYSTYTNRQFVPLAGRMSRFRTIRISRANGSPFIRRVLIEFADGTNQVVRVDRALEPGRDVFVDLQGGRRDIRRIVVLTRPDPQSAYSIFGD